MNVWLTHHHAWNTTQLVLYIMMQKHSVKQQICLMQRPSAKKYYNGVLPYKHLHHVKGKLKNKKKSDSAYNSNSNISCPVATPLTPVEIKHKPSTARALYRS